MAYDEHTVTQDRRIDSEIVPTKAVFDSDFPEASGNEKQFVFHGSSNVIATRDLLQKVT